MFHYFTQCMIKLYQAWLNLNLHFFYMMRALVPQYISLGAITACTNRTGVWICRPKFVCLSVLFAVTLPF